MGNRIERFDGCVRLLWGCNRTIAFVSAVVAVLPAFHSSVWTCVVSERHKCQPEATMVCLPWSLATIEHGEELWPML